MREQSKRRPQGLLAARPAACAPQAFTVASETLLAGAPTLAANLTVLQPASARVGASGAQQANGTSAALSRLQQQIQAMPLL